MLTKQSKTQNIFSQNNLEVTFAIDNVNKNTPNVTPKHFLYVSAWYPPAKSLRLENTITNIIPSINEEKTIAEIKIEIISAKVDKIISIPYVYTSCP